MGVALINDYFSGVACLNFLGSYVVQYQIDICEDIELNLYKYTCIYLYIHIHYNFIFWKWFINEPRQSQLNEFASWLRWVLDLAVGVTKMHKWLEKYCHFVCTRGPPTFQPHGPGQLDLLYQIAAAGRSETNACRNLHSLIHKRGLTLPLKIHTVEVPVRKRKPKVRKTWVHYPVILPSTWAKYLLESHSFLLLGGHDINHGTWQRELAMFWETYLKTDANHPMVKPGEKPGLGNGIQNLGHRLQRERCLSTSMGMRVVENTGYLSWSRPYRQLWALKGRPSRIQVGNSSQKVFSHMLYVHVELCWLPRVGCPK